MTTVKKCQCYLNRIISSTTYGFTEGTSLFLVVDTKSQMFVTCFVFYIVSSIGDIKTAFGIKSSKNSLHYYTVGFCCNVTFHFIICPCFMGKKVKYYPSAFNKEMFLTAGLSGSETPHYELSNPHNIKVNLKFTFTVFFVFAF